MNYTILILLLLIILGIAALLLIVTDLSRVSVIISLAALLISLISVFKDQIFPFQIKLLAGNIILAIGFRYNGPGVNPMAQVVCDWSCWLALMPRLCLSWLECLVLGRLRAGDGRVGGRLRGAERGRMGGLFGAARG
jgi:hypothetical protein